MNANIPFIIIITYGRSGSTLLQGLLNSIPGACIRGENKNAILHLQKFYSAIIESKTTCHNTHNTDMKDPWYGIDRISPGILRNKILDIILDSILNAPEDATIVGYKEIRYGRHYFPEYDDLKEYLLFLKMLFPNLKILLNYRDINKTLKSGWWPEVPKARTIIENIEGKMHRIREDFSHISHWVNYDKYLRDISLIEKLFNFIGAEYDESAVRQVLESRHSI